MLCSLKALSTLENLTLQILQLRFLSRILILCNGFGDGFGCLLATFNGANLRHVYLYGFCAESMWKPHHWVSCHLYFFLHHRVTNPCQKNLYHIKYGSYSYWIYWNVDSLRILAYIYMQILHRNLHKNSPCESWLQVPPLMRLPSKSCNLWVNLAESLQFLYSTTKREIKQHWHAGSSIVSAALCIH